MPVNMYMSTLLHGVIRITSSSYHNQKNTCICSQYLEDTVSLDYLTYG